MTVILIDDRGAGTIQIPDAEGEERSYDLTLGGPVMGHQEAGVRVPELPRSVRLTRLDTGDCYLVGRQKSGAWWCSCPSFTFAKRADKTCKHCQCLAPLSAWLRHLLRETVHAERF